MILVETQAVGPFFKNGFVVACPRTRQGVLIDPGDEVESLLTFAAQRALTLKWILLTHAHVDHVTGVPTAKRRLNVPVCLHREDLFLYERAGEQARMFGLEPPPPLPPIDHFYGADERFVFGDYQARVLPTPGHCPGGVCLECTPRDTTPADIAGGAHRDLFVGDTLFAGSIGRTDLPGGDHATLLSSIRQALFPLGDLARVHPGHGPATTIGYERRTNPFLQADS